MPSTLYDRLHNLSKVCRHLNLIQLISDYYSLLLFEAIRLFVKMKLNKNECFLFVDYVNVTPIILHYLILSFRSKLARPSFKFQKKSNEIYFVPNIQIKY